ncbi:MAG TPA: PAS domain S-box protein [Syntrophobacteria bacterium]|nr:PAS domain S-box protein [Syntrophobacteria bacterium]
MKEYSPEWLCHEVLEKARDAVIVADREGRVSFWNEGGERTFGYSRDEALGWSLDPIIPERLRERHWEGYRKVMATGVTRYGDEVLAVPALRRDGRRISIEFTILLLRQDGGDLIGTAAFIRDVTARWEKERELKKRFTELEAKLSPPGSSHLHGAGAGLVDQEASAGGQRLGPA